MALQQDEQALAMLGGEKSTAVHLAKALDLAAACFPEELRAAVGGGEGAAGGGGAEAAACGRVAGAAGGAADGGLSWSSVGARPCISLPAVRAFMGAESANAAAYGVDLELVAGVLGDADKRMGAQRELTEFARAWQLAFADRPGAARCLSMLMPPEAARAAVAAAAAACAPAGSVGTL